MLCGCDIKEKGYCCVFQNGSAERQSNESFCTSSCETQVSEISNLVGVPITTVYAIKKHIDNRESVNRRAGSGRKTVVDHDSLLDAIRGISLLAGCRSWDSLRDAIRGIFTR